MARQPIDLDHLARQTLGDGAIAREVLALFTAQARQLGGRIGAAPAEERRAIAHTVKGAASGVGAFALAECAARIEREPADEDLLAPFRALVDEACGFADALDGLAPRNG